MPRTEYGSEFVAESFRKWTGRFVANGVDPNDLDRLRTQIHTWDDWLDGFTTVGDDHTELAETALARDDTESAGEHFHRAAMYYHFGSHVWHEDEEARDEAHRTAVDLFQRAGEHLTPPVQRLEAPYDAGGFTVPGNLRVPERGPDGTPGDSPLVILLPGSDSTKEELDAYGRPLLQRGIATLAIDGPGQGESWEHQGMTPTYHRSVSAVVDYLRDVDPDGVDTNSLGVYGVSLGGFYAPLSAANDSRFDACVGISGKFTVGPASSWATPLHEQQYRHACKVNTMREVDEITEAMSLRDCIDELTAPSLMVTGSEDTVTHPDQTLRIAERAPNGEFVLIDGAGHVCNDAIYRVRPRIADWLRRQLA